MIIVLIVKQQRQQSLLVEKICMTQVLDVTEEFLKTAFSPMENGCTQVQQLEINDCTGVGSTPVVIMMVNIILLLGLKRIYRIIEFAFDFVFVPIDFIIRNIEISSSTFI